jgi:hypothetical protein
LWARPSKFLQQVMDKILSEGKFRLETSHPPPDRWLEWDEKETHLPEHVPTLNNTATALRRHYISYLEEEIR